MTTGPAPRIVPLGDSAVLVEFGNSISPELNDKALTLCRNLEAEPFTGFIESVPAYASAAVFYDAAAIQRALSPPVGVLEFVRSKVSTALGQVHAGAAQSREVSIVCRFAGPDLGEVADRAGLATSEVVDIFTCLNYRVYMLGFLPGFSYMGEVDERIACPRRSVPRARVPKGSVGIAGRQTGVYSLDSPGGWQIIGRTDQPMFLPDRNPPSYLMPGDRVRFIAE